MCFFDLAESDIVLDSDTRWRAPRVSREHEAKRWKLRNRSLMRVGTGTGRNSPVSREYNAYENHSPTSVMNRGSKWRPGKGKVKSFLRPELDISFIIGTKYLKKRKKNHCATSMSEYPLARERVPHSHDDAKARLTVSGCRAVDRKSAAMRARAESRSCLQKVVDSMRHCNRVRFSAARADARLPAYQRQRMIVGAAPARTPVPKPAPAPTPGVPRAPAVRYRAPAAATSDEPGPDFEDEPFELNVAMLSGQSIELSVLSGHTIYHVRDELMSRGGFKYMLSVPGQEEPARDAQTLFELGLGPEANFLFAVQSLSMRCEQCNLRFRMDETLSRRRLEHCSGVHLGEYDARGQRWSCCGKTKRGSPGCAKGHLHSWVPIT